MNKPFTDASWIWYTETAQPDSYGDFVDRFDYAGGKVVCHLSCDGDYTLFVNGQFVASNQYGDFEHYKVYDSVDITEHLVVGTNMVLFTVWHFGINSSRYKVAKAGLLYAIERDGETVCKSDEQTLARQNPHYKSGYQKMVSPQLGLSFLFDATVSEDAPFGRSVVVDKSCVMVPRPIPKLRLLDRKDLTVLKNEGDHYLLDLGEETVGLPTLRFYLLYQ